jgi:tight adherence protein B
MSYLAFLSPPVMKTFMYILPILLGIEFLFLLIRIQTRKKKKEAVKEKEAVKKLGGEKAGDKSLRDRLSRQLLLADLNISPENFLKASLIIGLLLGFTTTIVSRSIPWGIVGFFIAGIIAPWVIVKQRMNAIEKVQDHQFLTFLRHFSSELRFGTAHLAAFSRAVASPDLGEPFKSNLRRVEYLIRKKRKPFTEALEESLKWIKGPQYCSFVQAFLIQQEVGGDLGEVTQTIINQLTNKYIMKKRMKAKIASVVNEGRFLVLFVPIVVIFLYLFNPKMITPLFTNIIGWIVILFAILLELVGMWWTTRMVKTVEKKIK